MIIGTHGRAWRGGVIDPLPTIVRAVSGSVRAIIMSTVEDAIVKNQNTHLQPARKASVPPRMGPRLGAVVILNSSTSVPCLSVLRTRTILTQVIKHSRILLVLRGWQDRKPHRMRWRKFLYRRSIEVHTHCDSTYQIQPHLEAS